MGGPAARIITKNIITEYQILDINTYIKNNASIIEGNDFWINERPFYIKFGEDYENEIQEYIDNGFTEIIGWKPKDTLTIVAMCNQQIDHEKLAELCINISQIIDGLIDFGGKLNINNDLIIGKLFNIPFTNVFGDKLITHIGDNDFLKNWLASKYFRMIK